MQCSTQLVTRMAGCVLFVRMGMESQCLSMLSEISKESRKGPNVEGGGMDGWKNKIRKEHFPILEKHLLE